MKDYRLRILRERHDALSRLAVAVSAQCETATSCYKNPAQLLESAIRTRSLLQGYVAIPDGERKDPSVHRIEELLWYYRNIEVVVQKHSHAVLLIPTLIAVTYYRIRYELEDLIERRANQEEHVAWVEKYFGTSLAQYLPIGPDEEIITKYQKGRLDVFFGGQGNPLGPDHGHYVFSHSRDCPRARRDPGQRRSA
jgi:hypothetical protein